MDKVTDEEIIEDYLNGNDFALKEIIDRYTSILFNFISRFGFSEGDVTDILQNVFIKVWKNAKNFDSEKSSFKTWVFTITRNTVYDELRKKKDKTALISLNDTYEGGNEIEIEDVSKDIVDVLERADNKKVLLSALEELSFEEKNIILLHFEESLTFSDIAKMLKMKENTVKSKHRRALVKLRDILEEHRNNN